MHFVGLGFGVWGRVGGLFFLVLVLVLVLDPVLVLLTCCRRGSPSELAAMNLADDESDDDYNQHSPNHKHMGGRYDCGDVCLCASRACCVQTCITT